MKKKRITTGKGAEQPRAPRVPSRSPPPLHLSYNAALWSDWLLDEIGVATTPDDRRRVLALFEQAVLDYLCTSESPD